MQRALDEGFHERTYSVEAAFGASGGGGEGLQHAQQQQQPSIYRAPGTGRAVQYENSVSTVPFFTSRLEKGDAKGIVGNKDNRGIPHCNSIRCLINDVSFLTTKVRTRHASPSYFS